MNRHPRTSPVPRRTGGGVAAVALLGVTGLLVDAGVAGTAVATLLSAAAGIAAVPVGAGLAIGGLLVATGRWTPTRAAMAGAVGLLLAGVTVELTTGPVAQPEPLVHDLTVAFSRVGLPAWAASRLLAGIFGTAAPVVAAISSIAAASWASSQSGLTGHAARRADRHLPSWRTHLARWMIPLRADQPAPSRAQTTPASTDQPADTADSPDGRDAGEARTDTADSPAAQPAPAAKTKAKAKAKAPRKAAARQAAPPPGGLEVHDTVHVAAGDRPPVTLLKAGQAYDDTSDNADRTSRLQQLFDALKVDATVTGFVRGPAVTRIEVELGVGERVQSIKRISDDLAYTLAVASVRIVAPIPGRSAIGIEVANVARDTVTLRDIVTDAPAPAGPLEVPVGVDLDGAVVTADLAKLPHLLVAGTTGSGKSVMVNAMLTSVLLRNAPQDVRLVLIDPKRVEFARFGGAPHLLTDVVTDARKATDVLHYLVEEMEARYALLEALRLTDLGQLHQRQADGDMPDPVGAGVDGRWLQPDGTGWAWKPVPLLLVAIDELADLMMVAAKETETAIARLAQKARAVGIHLILATQRPSTKVISGDLKSNVPARLSMSVATSTDSQVIIDQPGAEALLGAGDMLLVTAAHGPRRLQGPFVSGSEIDAIVDWWSTRAAPDRVDPAGHTDQPATTDHAATFDANVKRTALLVARSGQAVVPQLVRRLKLPAAEVTRILDQLEGRGIIGPVTGTEPRQVLMTAEEIQALFVTAAAAAP